METGDSDDDASSVPMDLSQPSPDKRMVSESVDQELLGLKIFPEMLKKAELSSFPQEYQRIDHCQGQGKKASNGLSSGGGGEREEGRGR